MAIPGIPIYDKDEIGNSLSAINNAFIDVDTKLSNLVTLGGGTFTGGITGTDAVFTKTLSAAVIRGYGGYLTGMVGVPGAIGNFYESISAPLVSGVNVVTSYLTATNYISAPTVYGNFSGDGSRLYNLTAVAGLTNYLPTSGGTVIGQLNLSDVVTTPLSSFSTTIVADSVKSQYDPHYSKVISLNRNTGTAGGLPADSAGTGVTWTWSGSTGTIQLTSKYVKFNKNSLYINAGAYGQTQKFLVASNFPYAGAINATKTLDFASPFTIEFWVFVGAYPNTTGAGIDATSSLRCASLFDTYPKYSGATVNGFCLGLRSDGTLIAHYNGTYNANLGSISLAKWTHVVLTRIGSSVYVGIDGQLYNLGSFTIYANEGNIYFGSSPGIAGYPGTSFGGNLFSLADTAFSEMRMTMGVARYTASPYSVPSSFFPWKETNRINIDSSLAVSDRLNANATSVGALEVFGNTSLVGSLLSGTVTPITYASALYKTAITVDGSTQFYIPFNGSTFSYPLIIGKNYGSALFSVYLGASVYLTGVSTTSGGSVSYVFGGTGAQYAYRSFDYGTTWSPINELGSGAWNSVKTNKPGTQVVACGSNVQLKFQYPYVNSSWYSYGNLPTANWIDVALSDNLTNGASTVILAAQYLGYLYVSTNAGSNWTAVNNKTSRYWKYVDMSSDGSIQVAVEETTPYVHISKDFGSTWTVKDLSVDKIGQVLRTPNVWNQMSVSSDGSKIVLSSGSTSGFYSGVAVSVDYGDTWTFIDYGSYYSSAVVTSDASRWFGSRYNFGAYSLCSFVPTAGNLYVKGKVGIGTSIPNKALTVVGEISSTVSISAPALSGSFYGNGSGLTNVTGTDSTKLPLAGGTLTGGLVGTTATFVTGTFTASVSAPALSGTHYGDGSKLTNVVGTDATKLPLAGGTLTGGLAGTTATFTASVSAPALSGTHHGDGSRLTNVVGTDATKLPLAGGTLTGGLAGTTASFAAGTFTTSVSAPALSGVHYGDGSRLTNVVGTDATKLPLTGGSVSGVLNVAGNVGIGTSSPLTPLEIYKINSGGEGGSLSITNNVASGLNSSVALYLVPNAGGGHDLQRAASIKSVQTTAGNYADLRFTTANSDTPVERLRITSDGNVGIGTTAPLMKLHVKTSETGPVGGASGVSQLLLSNNATNNATMRFQVAAYDGDYNPLVKTGDQTIIFSGDIANSTSSNLVIGPWSSNGVGMRITSTGNIGIGTSTPSQKLTVVGNISATGTIYGDASNLNFTNVTAQLPYYAIDFSDSNTSSTTLFTSAGSLYANFAIDSSGNVFAVDTNNHVVVKYDPITNIPSVFCGLASTPGNVDGSGNSARFNSPQGICIDSDNSLYVSDTNNNTIRKITSNGVVITVAGTGVAGLNNSTLLASTFRFPKGIAVQNGVLYVADSSNHVIRKIDIANNLVTTFAGNGTMGSTNSTYVNSSFTYPSAIAINSNGDIFVAGTGYYVRRLSSNTVTAILGNGSGNTRETDGTGSAATVGIVRQFIVGQSGEVYFTDYNPSWTNSIRKITLEPDGITYRLTTICSTLNSPYGLAMDIRRRCFYVANVFSFKKLQANIIPATINNGILSIARQSTSQKGGQINLYSPLNNKDVWAINSQSTTTETPRLRFSYSDPGPFTLLGASIDGTVSGDYSGYSVSLNAAGTIVAIGAYLGDPVGKTNAGIVKIYQWSGSAWSQLGATIDGGATADESGYSVSLNAAGTIVAIGAILADPSSRTSAGSTKIYQWNGTAWVQLGLSIDGAVASDQSGWSVSLNSAGDRVAIGAIYADPGSPVRPSAGTTVIYQWNGSAWSQMGSAIEGATSYDQFGYSVSLNAAGDIVAIGANGANPSGKTDAGTTSIYQWNGSAWSQIGLTIEGFYAADQFGFSVSLNDAGDRVAVGAIYADPNNRTSSGAVVVYQWDGITWGQMGLTLVGGSYYDQFGYSVSLNAAGDRVAVGANYADPNLKTSSGSVKIFEWNGSSWGQVGLTLEGAASYDYFGQAVSLNAAGDKVAVGAYGADPSSRSLAGKTYVYSLDLTNNFSEKMAILQSGNVGINTTAPTAKLQIVGDSLAYDAGSITYPLALTNSNGSNTNHVRFHQYRSSYGTTWTTATTRIQNVTDVTSQAYLEFNPPGVNYGLALGTGINGSVQAMLIDGSGNVSVNGNVQVNGNINVSGTVYGASYISKFMESNQYGSGNDPYRSFGYIDIEKNVRVIGANTQSKFNVGSTTHVYGPDYGTLQLPPGVFADKLYMINPESVAVIDTNGSLYMTGYNNNGYCGIGNTVANVSVLSACIGIATPVVQFISTNEPSSDSANTNYALTNDGCVYAWGYNQFGSIGDGTATAKSTPTLVLGPGNTYGNPQTAVAQIVTGGGWNGSSHPITTIALLTDGTVWGVGYGGQGQMGNNTTTSTNNKFVQATGLTGITKIGISGYDTASSCYALNGNTGVLYAWGYNGIGQLGNNTTSNILVPTAMLTTNIDTNLYSNYFVDFYLGNQANEHVSIFVKAADGYFYACGRNANGQLGLGSTTDVRLLTRITSLASLAGTDSYIVTGTTVSTFAVCNNPGVIGSNQQLYATGYNAHGQLGLGDTVQRTSFTPVRFYNSKGIKSLHTFYDNADSGRTFLLTNDNQMYACGYSYYGMMTNADTSVLTFKRIRT